MSSIRVHRRATVPAALSLLSLSLAAPVAQAQTPSAEVITVTATRTPLRVADAVAEVTVLDRAAIERVEGRTLVELLSLQPGLQFSSNGGLGKSGSLFIRGLEARHTLLLVDGVRIQSATLGLPSLDNIPLEAVERIEIVRGPMSSLYGNGAMGGVVQVFTRRGTQGLTANASAALGTHDFNKLSGGVGFGGGGFDVAAQVQRTHTDGFSATNPAVPFGSFNADRDGFRQNAGSVRLGWAPVADWRVEVLGLHSKGNTQLDDGLGADARADLTNDVVSVSAAGRVLNNWRTRISVANSSDGYDTRSSASAFASIGEIKTRQQQIGWENTIDTPVGTVLALAERITEKVSRPGAPFAVRERDIDGLSLGLNGKAGAHVWQGSLRHDRNSQFGNANTGAVGYGYSILYNLRLAGSYGTSFVAPSFNQLYFPNFANPLLVPEKGKHGEVSLSYQMGTHDVRATYYEHRYRGFFTSGPGTPVNLPKAKVEGVSLSYLGRYAVGSWGDVDINASYDHTDPRNATVANANNDKLLPRRARNVARLGADYKLGAFSAGATASGVSHRFDNAANTVRLGGYGVLDLRAEWAINRAFSLGAKLNNAGGKAYQTALGYNQPGREGFVTLRYVLR